jgi:drug/metabolite transporter (DMT)-like permease
MVMLPLGLVFEFPPPGAPSLGSVGALLALAVFSTAMGVVIYFRLLRTLGVVGTTAQAYLRVPIGTAIGVGFLGETLPSSAWAGFACVLAGVMAMTLPERRRAAAGW